MTVAGRVTALRRRIRVVTCLFMLGLLFGGATAIPLNSESTKLVQILGLDSKQISSPGSSTAGWILKVRDALSTASEDFPFLFYGTDWLAFGHFVIAIAFIGALRDPVRNRWLFDFGMIACVLVIPYAFVFGAVRGIPIWWRLIDCSFGVFGFVPLWFCRKWARELESAQRRTEFS